MEVQDAEKASRVSGMPDPNGSPTSQSVSSGEAGSLTCRVCLEEDTPGNLMAPCSCTGSMMVRIQNVWLMGQYRVLCVSESLRIMLG